MGEGGGRGGRGGRGSWCLEAEVVKLARGGGGGHCYCDGERSDCCEVSDGDRVSYRSYRNNSNDNRNEMVLIVVVRTG